ncbi:MAG: hypothetical protein K2N87_11695 [Eubacterium sp.]|nr:hypothetical protein [Eubacterium sp.]
MNRELNAPCPGCSCTGRQNRQAVSRPVPSALQDEMRMLSESGFCRKQTVIEEKVVPR